jgi:hypothetical protein
MHRDDDIDLSNDGVFVLQGDQGIVELFDEDFPTDDHLGGHIIRKDELGQGFRLALFKNEDAHYELDYILFEG